MAFESRRIGMLTPSILVALLAACGGDSQPRSSPDWFTCSIYKELAESR